MVQTFVKAIAGVEVKQAVALVGKKSGKEDLTYDLQVEGAKKIGIISKFGSCRIWSTRYSDS